MFHFALTRRQPSPILRAGASLAHTYADIHRPLLPSMSYLQDTGNKHLNTGQDSSGWPPRTIHIHPKVLLQRLFQDPGKWQIPGEAFDRVASRLLYMQPYSLWTQFLTSWKYSCVRQPKWVRFEILGVFLFGAIWVNLQNSSSLKDDSKLTMYTGDILFQEVTPANADAFNGNAVEYLGGERKTTTRDLWEFLATWLWIPCANEMTKLGTSDSG